MTPKPKKTTLEAERVAIADKDRQAYCDLVITRAAELMVEQNAPIEMILDRMLTYATAQAMRSFGKGDALSLLQLGIKGIRAGALDHLQLSKH
jgi:hypothetical protein